ncbi:hypothetical protein ACFV9C_25255 [Kribbella sp. NPDC059898]|uniref:hypothetical protein n=1 Tax=Kribbella sp. NPDC059898 TaxID=3346995 RepID=UPI0036686F50
MCWVAHEAKASVRLDGETHVLCGDWHTKYEEADAGRDEHERTLNELYGLTPAQVHLYDRVINIVDEALEQFDKGYAVCVEEQTADLAKELCP